MSSAGFEPAFPAIERLQAYALECAATGIGSLVTTLPVNSDVLVPKEKQDGLSAVNKIKLVMKSVLSSERSVQLYQIARCTGLERNMQWSGRWMGSEAQWFDSSQRKDFVLQSFHTSSGDRQTSY